ncbi:WAS/WASL-interacting protein family member 1 isoform X2 [Pseudophryne corroboree]
MPVPPPPPPPPTFSQANVEKPSLSRSELSGRNALLSDIGKGRKLKKAVTNDRSGPILDKPKTSPGGGGGMGGGGRGMGGGGGGMGGGSGGSGGPPSLGGLFQGGMPRLRPSGSRESESPGNRPPMLPPGGRMSTPRPFTPPGASPRGPAPPIGRSAAPEPLRNRMPPPPRNHFSSRSENIPPSVPNTPRPLPSSLYNRGPPPVPAPNRQITPTSAPPPISFNKGHGFGGNSRQSSSAPQPAPSMYRPPLPQTPTRPIEERPPPPPTGNRPPLSRDVPPPPPPQNNKPPVPNTPRPNTLSQTPPLPPGRPGPPPLPPTPSTFDDMPRLPQRNSSLPSISSAPPPIPPPTRSTSGPPPPPSMDRPPPPFREPPGRSGPLPPPPPTNRNGFGHRGSVGSQSNSRPAMESPRSVSRPPPPPERPGLGSLPPPPHHSSSVRNGYQDTSGEDEWEKRFLFHPFSDLPPPEPYVPTNKTYPSKLMRGESRSGSSRRERGAPPLPPIPR